MLRSLAFFVLLSLLAACESFATGTSPSNGSLPPPGDGGLSGSEGGGGGPPNGEGRCATAPAGSFCDSFDRDGDLLSPPWDFASAKGVTLSHEGPSASAPGSLLIEVGTTTTADQPTYVMKSFPARRQLRVETKVNFIEVGEGSITLLSFVIDSPGGGVFPYRVDFWRQFVAQPWRLEEFKQGGGRQIELNGATGFFDFPTATWSEIDAEIDLDTKVFRLRIGGQQWLLESLDPPTLATRCDVRLGLPQAVNVTSAYKVRFDDALINPSSR